MRSLSQNLKSKYIIGGILNNVNPIDFANGRIGSKIRNPLIATVLFKDGLIDAFGTGFERTFKVCAENGVGYEYENDEFGFSFIFKRKGEQLQNDKMNDKKNDKIESLDNEIVRILRENPHMTIPLLAEKVQRSVTTVHRHLDSLSDTGDIERVGSRKSGYWKVLK